MPRTMLDKPSRATAAFVAIVLATFETACVIRSWRAVPITEVSLVSEELPTRTVLLDTAHGPVTLRVTHLDFPYIEGVPEAGPGLVTVDLSRVTSIEYPWEPHRTRTVKPVNEATLREYPLPGRKVDFALEDGTQVGMEVMRVVFPVAEGRPLGGNGPVRVDLRTASHIRTRRTDGVLTVLATVGTVTAVAGGLLLLWLATKESCPFVYVDRGQGLELVGEAYPGAAFRSIQRGDWLPLPALEGGAVRIQLRNEARETQYTDQAELAFVDHEPGVRVLASPEGGLWGVGTSRGSRAVRDLRGRDLLDRLASADGAMWETDVLSESVLQGELRDALVAELPVPEGAGPLVLELVAGNTPWLDLVFGRFFATMGSRLPKYLEAGNRASAGAGMRAWKEREGVDLGVVLVGDDGTETRVATVPTLGPVATRRIAVPLTEPDQGTVRVKLEGGFGFWRVDQLAVVRAFRRPVAQRVAASSARTSRGADSLLAVRARDGQYDALDEMDEALDLVFDLPPVPDGLVRTSFLVTNGYYNVHPPVQRQWAPRTLLALRREPRAFSRFSRDLARHYADLLREPGGQPSLQGGRP